MTRTFLRALCGLMVLAAPSCALAQADAFAGKTVHMIIGFGVGGGYDLWGRPVARHIGKHLPGAPNVVPQNMPGAGSFLATSHIYNAAPRHGSGMAGIGRDAALRPLPGAGAVRYHAPELARSG